MTEQTLKFNNIKVNKKDFHQGGGRNKKTKQKKFAFHVKKELLGTIIMEYLLKIL